MELEGWTNDRLIPERLARLEQSEWIYDQPNSGIIMAAFLDVPPGGIRFNSDDMGAWYAAASLNTAFFEVAYHLRRQAFARGEETISGTTGRIPALFTDRITMFAVSAVGFDRLSRCGATPERTRRAELLARL